MLRPLQNETLHHRRLCVHQECHDDLHVRHRLAVKDSHPLLNEGLHSRGYLHQVQPHLLNPAKDHLAHRGQCCRRSDQIRQYFCQLGVRAHLARRLIEFRANRDIGLTKAYRPQRFRSDPRPQSFLSPNCSGYAHHCSLHYRDCPQHFWMKLALVHP